MSDREVATYIVNKFLGDLEAKILSPDFFNSEEFQEFMGRSYPSLRMSDSRKEKLTDQFAKLMERARRPIKTTLKTYGYEEK